MFDLEKLDLPAAFRACLKILHRYRNAAHHRDTVRPDVLGPAVQIYFFLCCHLLKRERHMAHEINAAPPAVLEVFEGAQARGTVAGRRLRKRHAAKPRSRSAPR